MGSLVLLPMVLKGIPKVDNFLVLAGMAISGWIIVQMIMMLEVNWFHGLYMAISLALLYIGTK